MNEISTKQLQLSVPSWMFYEQLYGHFFFSSAITESPVCTFWCKASLKNAIILHTEVENKSF